MVTRGSPGAGAQEQRAPPGRVSGRMRLTAAPPARFTEDRKAGPRRAEPRHAEPEAVARVAGIGLKGREGVGHGAGRSPWALCDLGTGSGLRVSPAYQDFGELRAVRPLAGPRCRGTPACPTPAPRCSPRLRCGEGVEAWTPAGGAAGLPCTASPHEARGWGSPKPGEPAWGAACGAGESAPLCPAAALEAVREGAGVTLKVPATLDDDGYYILVACKICIMFKKHFSPWAT